MRREAHPEIILTTSQPPVATFKSLPNDKMCSSTPFSPQHDGPYTIAFVEDSDAHA